MRTAFAQTFNQDAAMAAEKAEIYSEQELLDQLNVKAEALQIALLKGQRPVYERGAVRRLYLALQIKRGRFSPVTKQYFH